jgi:hypothetical protein
MRTLICTAGAALMLSSCSKYLDVNTNPNGPEVVDPALYLSSIEANYALGMQFDARLIGPYVQNFHHVTASTSASTGTNNADRHGYVRLSDFGGDIWRNVYWKGGVNTLDMIDQAKEQKKWDLVGVGYVLQAFGWQWLTDYHGEIILREAFNEDQNTFKYDAQDVVYSYVDSLTRAGIAELEKNSDGVGSTLFSRFDQIYKGDRARWRKFAWGLLAIQQQHLSKKSSLYKPDSVIAFVDRAFANNTDDALVPYLGQASTDANFFGPLRNNLPNFGQSAFIVRLTDGTVFTGAVDPRRLAMLTPSTDGIYRGLQPGVGQSNQTVSTSVRNLWGTTLASAAPTGTVGKYLFQNNAVFPIMSYAQLQFIKAEAAFIKGDKALARTAYMNGVNASLDFVRTYAPDLTAYNAARTAYIASASVIPPTPNDLTLSQIMLQKYIAQWGWGFLETWCDLRKYDYDPTVFTSFTLPDPYFVDNNGKPAYRVRPRYNSEYIWNVDALTAIGGFEIDFHTKKMWIHQP